MADPNLDDEGLRPLLAVGRPEIDNTYHDLEQTRGGQDGTAKSLELYRYAIKNAAAAALVENQKQRAAQSPSRAKAGPQLQNPVKIRTLQDVYLVTPTGQAQFRCVEAIVCGSVSGRRMRDEIATAYNGTSRHLSTVNDEHIESHFVVHMSDRAIVVERTTTIKDAWGSSLWSSGKSIAEPNISPGTFEAATRGISIAGCHRIIKSKDAIIRKEVSVVHFNATRQLLSDWLEQPTAFVHDTSRSVELSWRADETRAAVSVGAVPDLEARLGLNEEVWIDGDRIEIYRDWAIPLNAPWLCPDTGAKFINRRLYRGPEKMRRIEMLEALDASVSRWDVDKDREVMIESSEENDSEDEGSGVSLQSGQTSASSSSQSSSGVSSNSRSRSRSTSRSGSSTSSSNSGSGSVSRSPETGSGSTAHSGSFSNGRTDGSTARSRSRSRSRDRSRGSRSVSKSPASHSPMAVSGGGSVMGHMQRRVAASYQRPHFSNKPRVRSRSVSFRGRDEEIPPPSVANTTYHGHSSLRQLVRTYGAPSGNASDISPSPGNKSRSSNSATPGTSRKRKPSLFDPSPSRTGSTMYTTAPESFETNAELASKFRGISTLGPKQQLANHRPDCDLVKQESKLCTCRGKHSTKPGSSSCAPRRPISPLTKGPMFSSKTPDKTQPSRSALPGHKPSSELRKRSATPDQKEAVLSKRRTDSVYCSPSMQSSSAGSTVPYASSASSTPSTGPLTSTPNSHLAPEFQRLGSTIQEPQPTPSLGHHSATPFGRHSPPKSRSGSLSPNTRAIYHLSVPSPVAKTQASERQGLISPAPTQHSETRLVSPGSQTPLRPQPPRKLQLSTTAEVSSSSSSSGGESSSVPKELQFIAGGANVVIGAKPGEKANLSWPALYRPFTLVARVNNEIYEMTSKFVIRYRPGDPEPILQPRQILFDGKAMWKADPSDSFDPPKVLTPSSSAIGTAIQRVTNFGPAEQLADSFARRAPANEAPPALNVLPERLALTTAAPKAEIIVKLEEAEKRSVLVRIVPEYLVSLSAATTLIRPGQSFTFQLVVPEGAVKGDAVKGQVQVEWVAMVDGHAGQVESRTRVEWIAGQDGIVCRRSVPFVYTT